MQTKRIPTALCAFLLFFAASCSSDEESLTGQEQQTEQTMQAKSDAKAGSADTTGISAGDEDYTFDDDTTDTDGTSTGITLPTLP